MRIPDAFCVQTGTLMSIAVALQTCVDRGGEPLDFLCPNADCQQPQTGQKHPARISGVSHQSLYQRITPLRAPHFRVFGDDVHAPECQLIEYGEADREVGSKRRGRLILQEQVDFELPLVIDEFRRHQNIDEASAGQITDKERKKVQGATRAVRRDVYKGAFEKNKTQTSRLVRMVEVYEALKKLGLLRERFVRIDGGAPIRYQGLFRWVNLAAKEPRKQLINGAADLIVKTSFYILEFRGVKENPIRHRIYVKFSVLEAYRFRARLIHAIAQIQADKTLLARVYFDAQPTPDPRPPGAMYFRIDDLDDLVIQPEKKLKPAHLPPQPVGHNS